MEEVEGSMLHTDHVVVWDVTLILVPVLLSWADTMHVKHARTFYYAAVIMPPTSFSAWYCAVLSVCGVCPVQCLL